NDGTVRVWDVGTGELVREFNDGRRTPQGIARVNDGARGWLLSPDGKTVWVLDLDRSLREVAATHGEVLRKLRPPELLDEKQRQGDAIRAPNTANCLAGGRVFVSLHEERLPRRGNEHLGEKVAAATVWDAESGEVLQQL